MTLEVHTVSNNNIKPFDLLRGQSVPFEGFGDILPNSTERNEVLSDLISQAIVRVENGFGINETDSVNLIFLIERIVCEMWIEGWNQEEGNINLFATDFGLILVKIISDLYGGEFIFRSEISLNHFSIWWVDKGVEVFPFHKTYNRLINESGESIYHFIQGLQMVLTEAT